MDIFKTRLFIDGINESRSFLIDTIFYQGEWWLVSSWFYHDIKNEKIPDQLVRLTGLVYEEVGHLDYRFFLHNSIPKAVLDGTSQDGYVLASYPALIDTQGSKSTH
jgi:hypothetical protein